MPRLFIHLHNGNGLQRDERGVDYPSEDAAVQQAGRSAGAILADDLSAGMTHTRLKLCVEREDGSCIATINVTAALERT